MSNPIVEPCGCIRYAAGYVSPCQAHWLRERVVGRLLPKPRNRSGPTHALSHVTPPHEYGDDGRKQLTSGSVLTWCEQRDEGYHYHRGWLELEARIRPRTEADDPKTVAAGITCSRCLRKLEQMLGRPVGALLDHKLRDRQRIEEIEASATDPAFVAALHSMLKVIGALPGEDARHRAYGALYTVAAAAQPRTRLSRRAGADVAQLRRQIEAERARRQEAEQRCEDVLLDAKADARDAADKLDAELGT